jgi:Tfp pilus assembly protein PilN
MLDGLDQPPVTGDDLVACGVPRGPRIQELLAEAERLWLEGRLSSKEEVRAWLTAIGTLPP